MCFELLEGFEWMEVRVGVVETDDKSNGHKVVFCKMVQEGSSIRLNFILFELINTYKTGRGCLLN